MKDLNKTGPPALKTLPVTRKIDASEIDQLTIENDIVFVDTRLWEDYCIGHLPGSFFIPIESAFSTLIGSYIAPEASICLIVEDRDLDESIRHSVRVGVDNINYQLTPSQLRSYRDSGGNLITTDEIEMSELSELLSKSNTYLLDVRQSQELRSSGKIGEPHNIAHTQMKIRYNELPKDQRIYVYCRTGVRSRYATAFIAAMGYEVTNLIGGIEEWCKLSHPTN